MTAALHTSRPELHSAMYTPTLDIDFGSDNRYPTLPASLSSSQRTSGPQQQQQQLGDTTGRSRSPQPQYTNHMLLGTPDRPALESTTGTHTGSAYDDQAGAWLGDDANEPQAAPLLPTPASSAQPVSPTQVPLPTSPLPTQVGAPYPYTDSTPRHPVESSPVANTPRPSTRPSDPSLAIPQDRSRSITPISPYTDFPSPSSPVPRQMAPGPGVGAGGPRNVSGAGYGAALMASAAYNPPVSPRPRAYAQQPTYVTPAAGPSAPLAVPQQDNGGEVCLECAMRDQDMADVDVTSPGVWERASDAAIEELKQREAEEEAAGIVNDDPNRPRTRGGLLTEQNLKVWLTMNPKEPQARQQTLSKYVKAQRSLLEAEALAHAQAMQEAKRLDSRARDTYSQLRRSAYDIGVSPAPSGDTNGVRIKPPRSPSQPPFGHTKSQSRDLTLLENGMIVEHVDVRKEEREARDRRKRDERRARKSSRGSVIDMNSIISAGDTGLRPSSHYSAGSPRPMSLFTAHERPDIPRALSQASFSDVQSMGTPSPRRSRFMGLRPGWMSSDSLAPSGLSGSMMDMHVALQREQQQNAYQQQHGAVDLNTPRRSQIWPPPDIELPETESQFSTVKKKKKGFARVWQFVKGGSKHEGESSRRPSRTYSRPEDEPLAPPPPLSYLVDRRPDNRAHSGSEDIEPDMRRMERTVHPTTSEPDMRWRLSQSPTVIPQVPKMQSTPSPQLGISRRDDGATSLKREKTLPPLPPGERPPPNDPRPRTMYTYDSRGMPTGVGPAHDFLPPQAPFREAAVRRQSFGGLSARATVNSQTLPTHDARIPLGAKYNEFGHSRRSLGRLDYMRDAAMATPRNVSTPSGKRKSRFLSSLFGKKAASPERSVYEDASVYQWPSMRMSGSDGPEDVMTNGYATSNSRHSAFSQSPARMSIMGRKPLEDLVQQDPEFVAYRYPSGDQRLDLLR
ncbi:hypothetical protein BD626DRAFT_422247 [Schizophyllum amplum]|uniref:Proteophosphoglycan ppg4 n=1 Tax=Schizophyllum amplum TaxID=97359 RepID=A0A550CYF4_9AGAR|nr:hypothetical protein BD626DRAFT_422247 [Auriculariopsis ampla]